MLDWSIFLCYLDVLRFVNSQEDGKQAVTNDIEISRKLGQLQFFDTYPFNFVSLFAELIYESAKWSSGAYKKLYFFGVVSLRSRRGSTLLRFIEEKMSTSLVFVIL